MSLPRAHHKARDLDQERLEKSDIELSKANERQRIVMYEMTDPSEHNHSMRLILMRMQDLKSALRLV